MYHIFKEKFNYPDFYISGWLAVPINPDKWSFTVCLLGLRSSGDGVPFGEYVPKVSDEPAA